MENAKRKTNKALLAFFICSVVTIVLGIASFILFGYVRSLSGMAGDFGTNLMKALEQLKMPFTYAFNSETDEAANYVAMLGGDKTTALAFSSVTYALSGLTLIGIVLGSIYVANKKKTGYIGYTAAMLANLFLLVILTTFSKPMFEDGMGVAKASDPVEIGAMVLELSTVVFGVLALVTTVVTYALGLSHARKSAVVDLNENTDPSFAPVLAEEAPIAEAVQEGEELGLCETQVEEEPVAEPVEEPAPTETPVEETKVEEEPKQEEPEQPKVEVNVNNAPAQPFDQAALAAMLREVVRDIVRDEIARNNCNQQSVQTQQPLGGQSITGTTFGGPLVVQYFNGGINGVTPGQTQTFEAPVTAEDAPTQEKPKPAVQPKPFAPKAPVAAEPAPAPVVTPIEGEAKPEKVYERLTFAERLLQSDKDVQDLYNEIKNEILSYGVKSRVSAIGDTFRLHKKMYVRITVAGKSLKLYFALDPKDYENSTLPVQDASGKGLYEEIPLCFKVKSGLSVRRCKDLIQATMDKDNLEQGEIGKVNWIKELKAELAAGKKADKEEE